MIYKTKDGYGFRPHEFDWRVGDRILSKDGKQFQKIIKIVPADAGIVRFLNNVMTKCKKYSGNGYSRVVITDRGFDELTTVWKDGTGEDYFMSNISKLPDYNF